MKKIISIVLTFIVVLVFGFSVCAAESPTGGASTDISGYTDEKGIEVFIQDVTISTKQSKGLKTDTASVDYDTVDIYDVYIKDKKTGKYVTESYKDYPIKITYEFSNAADVVGVYCWNNDTSTWDECSFTITDGKVNAKFDHLGPVAFLVGSESSNAPVDTTRVLSPQTGYDVVPYLVSATLLIMGSVSLFIYAGVKRRLYRSK